MDELRAVCAQAHKTAEMLRDNEWMLGIYHNHYTLDHDGPAVHVKDDVLREMFPAEEFKEKPIGHSVYVYTTLDGVMFYGLEERDSDV